MARMLRAMSQDETKTFLPTGSNCREQSAGSEDTTTGVRAWADPARINMVGVMGVMMVFVIAATALFGPIAACLVELFPTRVRYTAMSLPYHIGTGWIGGFVPFFAYAIVIGVGNIYSGLWYPFVFTLLSVVTCLFFLPETRGRSLDH